MYSLLIIILLLIFLLPLLFSKVESNLEVFLFLMGTASALLTKSLAKEFVLEMMKNQSLYMITFAVFIGGIIFRYLNEHIQKLIHFLLNHIPLRLFIFLLITILGLLSSVITAIIASLILISILDILPIDRKSKVNITVVSCFSIGMGAALTPMGEPLSIIVTSSLNKDFWYLLFTIGRYVIPYIFILGLLGTYFCNGKNIKTLNIDNENDSFIEILLRALKIFIFVIALEMLGASFRPIASVFVVKVDSRVLYWLNTSSAILDNATLAAAEISNKMAEKQIIAVLLGLIVSGGMMIPGNIPNIICAGKLKIKSKEWIKLGVPIGLITLLGYYIILFII